MQDVVTDIDSFIRENQKQYDACEGNTTLQHYMHDRRCKLLRMKEQPDVVDFTIPPSIKEIDHHWVSSVYLCIKFGRDVAELMSLDLYPFVKHNFSWHLFLPMITTTNRTALAYYYLNMIPPIAIPDNRYIPMHSFILYVIQSDNLPFFQQILLHQTINKEYYLELANEFHATKIVEYLNKKIN